MGEKILVSACLLGRNCRFDGGSCIDSEFVSFLRDKKIKAIGICPEELGGLKGLRGPFEFKEDAWSVIRGQSFVYDPEGNDYTSVFLKGGYEALDIAAKHKIKKAVFMDRSPSCSTSYVYDGSFNKNLKPGLGITAYILKTNMIEIFSVRQYIRLFDLRRF